MIERKKNRTNHWKKVKTEKWKERMKEEWISSLKERKNKVWNKDKRMKELTKWKKKWWK